MKMSLKRVALGLASAGLLTIYGCGGGGGSSSNNNAPPVSQLTGTAATGAALGNAPVTINNSAGNSPCVETSISTSALGSYTCTLKSGETAPFFIKVTDPTGNTAPLVSIATTTPVAGTPLTVNATSLTTAIVAQLNNGDALGVFNSRTFVAANLTSVTTNVVAQLQPVLTAISAPVGYNPFTTSITAATAANTGNTADLILDMVKVGIDPATGTPSLSTITNSTPVPLATATSTGTALPALTTSASSLSQAAQIVAAALTNCFAVPSAQRALATNTTIPLSSGGPTVTSVAAACQDVVTDGTNASPAYLHNGYNAGQHFYGLLTSATMDGAKFSVPEIMAFLPANTASTTPSEQVDRAIVNIRYIDNAGNPGNVISIAANLAGTATATRPTNWWLVGNQQQVDTGVRLNIRRTEQFNSANTGNRSGFLAGIQFTISTVGPNSTTLTAAHVMGDGLPSAGLWYYKNATSTASYMDLSSYRDPSIPNAAAYTITTGCPGSNCPNFWFAKSSDLIGTASYITNPVNGLWAQGTSEGSYNGSSGTKPKKGSIYTIYLYAGTTLTYTVKKFLLNDMIDPVIGNQLPWNSLGTQSQAALNPANATLNAALSTLTLDWTQNPAAQQIGSLAASITNGGTLSGSQNVAKGVSSATIAAPATYLFTGLSGTASATNGFRNLLFNYRTQDNSYKSAQYSYNP